MSYDDGQPYSHSSLPSASRQNKNYIPSWRMDFENCSKPVNSGRLRFFSTSTPVFCTGVMLMAMLAGGMAAHYRNSQCPNKNVEKYVVLLSIQLRFSICSTQVVSKQYGEKTELKIRKPELYTK